MIDRWFNRGRTCLFVLSVLCCMAVTTSLRSDDSDRFRPFRTALSEFVRSETFQTYQQEIAAESGTLRGVFHNFDERKEDDFLDGVEDLAAVYSVLLDQLPVLEAELELRWFRQKYGRQPAMFGDQAEATGYVRAYDRIVKIVLRRGRMALGKRVAPELTEEDYADVGEINELYLQTLTAFSSYVRTAASN